MAHRESGREGSTGTTLEELQRFQQDIARYRAKRKAASDEFEGFVRSLKRSEQPAATTVQPPSRPVPRIDPPRAPVVRDSAPTEPQPRPAIAALDQFTAMEAPKPDQPAGPESEPAGKATQRRMPLVAAALAGLAVVAFGTWLLTREEVPAPQTADPAQSAAAPAPVQPEPPAPVTPPATETELVTTRNVWLRVLTDGRRVVNRELPAGSRVPLTAEKTIEIRTGDAGAVRLTIRGSDRGTLGRDGEVVTRSFTVPER